MKNGKHVPAAIIAMAIGLGSGGCGRGDQAATDAAQQAARAATAEQAAKPGEAAFEQAIAVENWSLAKAHADVLMASYPDTQAAARVRTRYDAIKDKANAAKEQLRLQGLWSYNVEKVEGGRQLSASLYARDETTVGDGKKSPVRLIFRDHPAWGRSSYLVLQSGDFDCYRGCRLNVTTDDGAVKTFAGSRPKTDEAIAMFIEDERALWRLAKSAKTLSIEFPLKDAGKQTAVFETGGVDATKLAW